MEWNFVIYALILAGGKGTRLYPLSRANQPKQFLKVINNKSFLVNTVERITDVYKRQGLRGFKSKMGAEFGIAALVSLVDICTANNTVAIVTVGPIAKDISCLLYTSRCV